MIDPSFESWGTGLTTLSNCLIVGTEAEAIANIVERAESSNHVNAWSFTVLVPRKFMDLYDKLARISQADVLFLNYEEDQTTQLKCNHNINTIYVITCLGESAACNAYGNLSVAMNTMSEVGGSVVMYQVKPSEFNCVGAGDAKAIDIQSIDRMVMVKVDGL